MLSLYNLRNNEAVDEDNKLKRQVLLNVEKALKERNEIEQSIPIGDLSANDKLILNRLVISFVNTLDDNVFNYYKDKETLTQTEGLISKWNNLCVFYNNNIDRKYQSYLDSKIKTNDVFDKLDIVLDMAKENQYVDYLDLLELKTNLLKSNYKPITHILFSQAGLTPQNLVEKFYESDYKKIKQGIIQQAIDEGKTEVEANKIARAYKKNLKERIKNSNISPTERRNIKDEFGIPLQYSSTRLSQILTPFEIKKLKKQKSGEEKRKIEEQMAENQVELDF
jgi:hypothetical protein